MGCGEGRLDMATVLGMAAALLGAVSLSPVPAVSLKKGRTGVFSGVLHKEKPTESVENFR